MYHKASSKVCIENCFSDSFCLNVRVHQGSVLSPLLFILVLEALPQEFRTGCPWELLYADDLVIIAESVQEHCCKLTLWNEVNLQNSRLRVNMKKTKVMFSVVKI